MFRDKLSVAINKICLINLIDQLQLTISYKHVLLSEIRSNAKYQRNIYYTILDVHDISVLITGKNEEYHNELWIQWYNKLLIAFRLSETFYDNCERRERERFLTNKYRWENIFFDYFTVYVYSWYHLFVLL